MTPYRAMFGQKPRVGLGTDIPKGLSGKIASGILEGDMLNLLAEVCRC